MSPKSLFASLSVFVAAVLALLPTTSCDVPPPDTTTYFDRTIFPILNAGCARSPTGSGCHVADAKGNALGNLDVSSYAEINKRRDLLVNYGPYGRPAMLVKNVPPFQITVKSFDGVDEAITTDIKHTAGPVLDPTATGYLTLSQWMQNGATENNTGVPPPPPNRLACVDTVPPADPSTGFDPTKDPTNSDYQEFVSNVIPVMQKTCAAGNCHGTFANELYLTCGNTPEEKRWNYSAALQYLAQTASQAEIVRRPLAPAQGGSFHEGGVIWQTTGDGDYQSVLNWAGDAANAFTTEITNIESNQPNFMFFVHRIQPMLVKKGCMMLQCHSAAMFHEYRLRGGTGGSFSLAASEKNYALTLDQMALDSDDVNASRLVQKNLYRKEIDPTGGGIAHRGAALLEDFGPGNEASGTLCDAGAYDYDNDPLDKIPAYCLIREWHKRERADALAGKCNGGPCAVTPLSAIVYVKKTQSPAQDQVNDFDIYAPGSELHVLGATLDAAGNVQLGADADVTSGCGLSASTADIRRPASSYDGKKVAFAARSSASEPFSVYEMDATGGNCQKHAGINAVTGTSNGLPVHNFDPQYGPPDQNGVQPILFISTRGIDPAANYAQNFDYTGTQREPFDPTKPNPNLYVYEPDPNKAGQFRVRELSFQLNMERWPSFMNDGRMIYSVVKRAPSFYEVALRRQNLDGGDYHPLYSQRGSIGFYEATQVVELADKNFATVFSNPGWQHQGGVLGIFNRSLGIDFYSTNKDDYPIDASVYDPTSNSSPEQQFFLHSLTFLDGSGKIQTENGAPIGSINAPNYSQGGVYRSPSPLPNGKFLVSYSSAADPTNFDATSYALYVVDPIAETKQQIVAAGGIVDAVAVYGKYNHGTFKSRVDEPNGNVIVDPTQADAQIFVLDMSVLGSLLFQNTPTGRAVENLDANGQDAKLDSFDVYEDMPPDSSVTDFASGGAFVAKDNFGQVYVRRRKLGTVNLQSDKSAYFSIPGGVPIVLHLPDTTISQTAGYPRWQKEEMSFYPGERAHQSFQGQFFNGLCGTCHGSISGRPVDAALNPDLLTQASQVQALGHTGDNNLDIGPSQRPAPEGPPAGN
ncbi:MAG TPA: hypothetical protein VGH28_29685 [Polyangiaceae bacterium]|jgi:hypothetical protein